VSLDCNSKRGIEIHVESSPNTEFIEPELAVYKLTVGSNYDEGTDISMKPSATFEITRNDELSQDHMRINCELTRGRRPGQETEESKSVRSKRTARTLERYNAWMERKREGGISID
jgi:hypothetical protein